MNVIFIPVRGGSKSIPLKNIKVLNGKPLVYWTLKAALGCKYADRVYVATDSDDIKRVLIDMKNDQSIMDNIDKLEIIDRSVANATDEASTESVMIEFANRFEFDNICLVQATSPLLKADDLNKGFEVFNSQNVDSVLSVVKQKRFNWQLTPDGYAKPINYDYNNRPRRQDFNGYYVENGAFYIISKNNLLKTGCRLCGNIKLIEMDDNSYFEVDEPSDFKIIETMMNNEKKGLLKNTTQNIKVVLSDVDGCLTDGGMYYSENGDELKKFNAKDGMAFKLLKEKGFLTGIITGEDVKLNKRRVEKIGLDIYVPAAKNKKDIIKDIVREYGIDMNNVLYIGDDCNDIEALKEVGLSCCPKNAIKEVKDIVDFVLDINGGDGIIRYIYDYILK